MAGIKYTSKTEQLSYRVFSSGLNSTANPLNLKDEELSDVQNVDYDKFGAIVKRNGYTALNTSAFNSGAAWTSLHFLELSSGTDYLMGTCGNKLAKMDALDGTWDDITGSLTITAGNDNKWWWRTFKDIAYGTNNVDVPIKWTGSGNGAVMGVLTGLTKCRTMESFRNYFFMGNVTVSGTAHTTRVYWSTINDPETWSAVDFNEIGFKDTGGQIVALRVLGDRLVIFKEHSIWLALFTGDATVPFVFEKSQSSVGAISTFGVQEVKNGLVFFAQDGQYYFDGVDSVKMSETVSTTIQGFNKAKFEQVVSCYQREKNRFWLCTAASASSTNNRVLTFDSFNEAFGVYTGIASNAMTTARVSGDERIFFGDYSGYVYEADTGTNDNPLNVSTAINAYFATKWYDYGDLYHSKGIPHVMLYFAATTATLTVAYGFDLDTTYPNSVSVTTTSKNLYRVDMKGRGRLMSMKFSNATASETFQVYGLGKGVHLETDV